VRTIDISSNFTEYITDIDTALHMSLASIWTHRDRVLGSAIGNPLGTPQKSACGWKSAIRTHMMQEILG
jgi:hypothetical protein